MVAETRIAEMIAPSLVSMGYELVRVLISGQRRPVLQVMAERVDRTPMRVEDCADISRAISAILDVEDPIAGAYTLEVSSPGIDRPLTRKLDFERFAGCEAKIEVEMPIDGRKRFRGIVLGIEEAGMVRLAVEGGEVSLPFEDIRSAKLVLTDALLAAAAKEQEH
ncbi:MAG: ribosome maturation factor RimP [Alphaproteobacteria bacterium]|nr:ribosome maturation factor RimP [Alphaproteobacteria bacterium]